MQTVLSTVLRIYIIVCNISAVELVDGFCVVNKLLLVLQYLGL